MLLLPSLQLIWHLFLSTSPFQALKNEPLTLFGDGKQTRSFQFVSDLIEGEPGVGWQPWLALVVDRAAGNLVVSGCLCEDGSKLVEGECVCAVLGFCSRSKGTTPAGT